MLIDTSKPYRKLLISYGMRASMGDIGACCDRALRRRLKARLDTQSQPNVHQPTREHMKNDLPPIQYENLAN